MEARHATLRAHHKGKATTAEKGKGKVADVSPSYPTLATRLPSTGVTVRRPSEAIPEDPAAADKTFIFRRLEQMITIVDLQSMEGASLAYLLQSAAYYNFQAQLFHDGLNNAIKGLAKDSELLKFVKAAHSQEVKNLKADMTKLGVSLATAQEGFVKATEALRSAREDALKEFKESEDFHEEAMTHASRHARTIADQWLEGEVGKRYMLDLGEADYDMGYQDAQKEIFKLLEAHDAIFSPTRWVLLNPVTPNDNQGAEDATLNASVNTFGGEILMDNAYLDSTTNLLRWTELQFRLWRRMEENPSAALQLSRQRSRSSERHLPTGSSEVDANGVPQLED
nr:phosphatase and actin regulator 4A-like [Ipomoea batatas]